MPCKEYILQTQHLPLDGNCCTFFGVFCALPSEVNVYIVTFFTKLCGTILSVCPILLHYPKVNLSSVATPPQEGYMGCGPFLTVTYQNVTQKINLLEKEFKIYLSVGCWVRRKDKKQRFWNAISGNLGGVFGVKTFSMRTVRAKWRWLPL